ncbi:helix-turn-helix domain-containing protein [Streptomyces sp. NBC_01808]|uniref:helix-turn-helix transcriptional regulator n=1 Tax=Streptomyces sp. NBC_01808 TaxID=2975947 RepID=UPI002DDC68AD|nr:helix-turn-helix transcriptional regulator [Streptomyces sp. NBC_01808]WSA39508.1 helix-turn-helix domain-containing protein [Streptomyces sp. NBC_01808]
MKNTKRDDGDRAKRFADWLRDQLTRRGYDLSGPRSGGKSAFAEHSGISASTVGRMLRGDKITDTRVLGLLAQALGEPLSDILVRAGIITADELGAVQRPSPGDRRITPEQAADELGITDAQSRRVFVSMAETLQRTQPPTSTNGDQRVADQ